MFTSQSSFILPATDCARSSTISVPKRDCKKVVFREGITLVMADGNKGEFSGGTRNFLIAFGMASNVIPVVMLTKRSPVVAHL